MSEMERLEIARHRQALERDVSRLAEKYLRIVEWDVPEPDEDEARGLLLEEICRAAERLSGAR